MDVDGIRRAVLATIASIAPDTDVQAIRADRPLRPQIDLDSMDWLNVVAALHHGLSVDIPESDYERLETLDSTVAYLASRLAGPPAHAPGTAPPPRAPGTTPTAAELPTATYRVNGTAVTVRPMHPDDLPREADFVRHLSSETRYMRFMHTLNELSQAKLKYLTDVDQVRHVALVATASPEGKQVLVGVARYIVDPAGTGCEFAVTVDDQWQGSGLAGILMHRLMGIARARGLATMEGIVLAANTRMLKFTRQLGFTPQRDPEDRSTIRVVRSL